MIFLTPEKEQCLRKHLEAIQGILDGNVEAQEIVPEPTQREKDKAAWEVRLSSNKRVKKSEVINPPKR